MLPLFAPFVLDTDTIPSQHREQAGCLCARRSLASAHPRRMWSCFSPYPLNLQHPALLNSRTLASVQAFTIDTTSSVEVG